MSQCDPKYEAKNIDDYVNMALDLQRKGISKQVKLTERERKLMQTLNTYESAKELEGRIEKLEEFERKIYGK